MAEVRPIDANALYDQMTKGTKKYLVVEPGTKRIIEYGYYADDVLASIDQAPKLDYEPVRHGKWISAGNGVYYCSKCDSRVPFALDHRYCRNCGAKMDGGARR